VSHSIELTYVRVEVPDPSSLASFFTDVVGLAPGAPGAAATGGDLTWTDDDAVHRVLVGEGPANDVTSIGFEAVDEAAFEATVRRVAGAGFALTPADDLLLAARRVQRLVTIEAPWGGAAELALGLERWADAPATPLMPGGFLTDAQGFGHAVLATAAFDESVRFVTAGLAMARSDWLQIEIDAGFELEVHFFHCNARHHSLALARAPFELPQKLHHVMFETVDRDDVGRAFDRALASGLPIPNGLGRHDNDEMFSFYVESPAGFQVEVGHGARTIAQPWTGDRRYGRISVWGHQPVTRPGG
jgi:2,3-dihydroxybiphenyl 1,2-dioxygenase